MSKFFRQRENKPEENLHLIRNEEINGQNGKIIVHIH
jgi:hypothetical protein